MKNLFFVPLGLVLALFSATFAQAQIRLGVKAGLNINSSKLNEPFVNYNSSSIGFNAGMLAEINLTQKLYLRPELLYAQKGWTVTETPQTGPTLDRTMKLHYATLPVLVGYRIIPKLSVVAGPEVGYLLKTTSSPKNTIDFGDFYNKLDLGITLGAAFNLTDQFGLEARYIYGLTPIFTVEMRDQNGVITGTLSDGYSRVLQAGLFYRFGQ